MNPRLLSFHYTLKNKSGEVLDTSSGSDPLTYVEGSGQIIPGLEKNLRDAQKGDKRKVEVKASEAYGERNDKLVLQVPLDQLPQGAPLKEGTQFQVDMGGSNAHVFQITGVSQTHATLDGNHPLAGEDLFFDVEVTEARAATAEEVKAAEHDHDHEHGEGCDHDHGDGGGRHSH